jgi:hypothetical protein
MSRDSARVRRVPLHRPAALAGCAAVLIAVLAIAGSGGTWAAFSAPTASSGNDLTTRAAFPDYRTAVTDSGAVVYHRLDDAYGSSTAVALAGANGSYNGAAFATSLASGAIAAGAGGPRKAVTFSPGAYAVADTAFSVTAAAVNTQTLTLEAWVRTGYGGAVVSLYPDGAAATPGRVQLYVNSAGMACVGLTLQSGTLKEVCGLDASDTKVWTPGVDQASPAWHYVAAVIDPAAPRGAGTEVSVYVDGALVYDDVLSGTWPQTVAGHWRVASAPITTDIRAPGPAPDTWTGDIDEVAVYTAALDPTEIKKHYDVGKGTVAGTYSTTVTALASRYLYWQLDDPPGSGAALAVADASGKAHPGTHHGYPDMQEVGAPTGTGAAGTAVGLSGVNNISTGASRTTPAAFSTEVWFNSSGGTGPLVSAGSATLPDAAVYLTATGKLAYSMRTPKRTIVSTSAYTDSSWHLATTTMSAGGRMRLYVDGALAGEDTSTATTGTITGFWRWGGGGDYTAFTTGPGATYFTGVLDEASVYDKELSDEDVAVHWGAQY